MIDRIVKGLQSADLHVSRILTVAAGILIFCCMVLITLSIGGRYLFNAPIPSTVESSEVILVLIIFLPLAYIDIQGGHLRIMFLYSRLSIRGQNICDIIAKIVSFTLLSLMTWQTLNFALASWASSERSWGLIALPLWIPKFVIFFSVNTKKNLHFFLL